MPPSCQQTSQATSKRRADWLEASSTLGGAGGAAGSGRVGRGRGEGGLSLDGLGDERQAFGAQFLFRGTRLGARTTAVPLGCHSDLPLDRPRRHESCADAIIAARVAFLQLRI